MHIHVIDHESNAYRETVALRERILRLPLGLHFSREELAAESSEIHIACRDDASGELIGCVVLVPVDAGRIKMRQLAIDDQHRGKGLGSELVRYGETTARDRGHELLFCHARSHVVPFYEKLGYRAIGDPFIEVGIPHVRMEKRLG